MKRLLLILLLAFAGIAYADNTVNLYSFYGKGCPHCARMEIFLEEMLDKYPTLNISRYEVYSNNENRQTLQQYCQLCNANIEGVPTTFIDRKIFTGFSDSIAEQVESEIQRCLTEPCEDFADIPNNETTYIKDDSDPINLSNNYNSIVGWSFIVLVLVVIFYFLRKKWKP